MNDIRQKMTCEADIEWQINESSCHVRPSVYTMWWRDNDWTTHYTASSIALLGLEFYTHIQKPCLQITHSSKS